MSETQAFVEAGTYEGTVHKVAHLCTFLPVIFDEFGGFTVSGLYQSTVLEYRFETGEKPGEFATFSHYLQAATHSRIHLFIQLRHSLCVSFMIITVTV